MNIPFLLKTDPGQFVEKLLRRGVDAQPAIELYNEYRRTDSYLQAVRAEKNALRFNPNDQVTRDLALSLKEIIIEYEHKLAVAKTELQTILDSLPNIPDDTIPNGVDENDNHIVGYYAIPRRMDFVPKEHHILLESLMNRSAAAVMTGARFSVLNGKLAKLHRALGQFMLDVHTNENGFVEVNVPYLVNQQSVYNTGQLPKFKDDLFETTDGLYLIPTAEVSLTNIVAHQTLSDTDVPLRFVALTPCFRREAGSAGRDTHGLIRQHQFEKCELVTITTPDQSEQEHQHMLKSAESILTKLGLPYRRVLLCAGDMGFAAQKTYDLEVWFPGQNTYREISSVSNCGEFQARRMNTRFKKAGTKDKAEFVHTLNGSGLAVGRTLAALVENYQQEDGSILIPNELQRYMGGATKI